MKKLALIAGLATWFVTQMGAGETLLLKVVPDREYILSSSPQEVTVRIDLTGVARKRVHPRPPLNLAVVLDKSGSMTGAKIEKARQAAMQVVDQLGPDDTLSIVVYSDRADVFIPAQHVEDKAVLKEQISRIQPGGSTALYAGVNLGADQLAKHLSRSRINRVILLSDGLANVGPSSPRQLRELGHSLSERGIAVTTIGVGDDYNEDLMAGLAQASDANYYYVKDTEKLPQIFAKELGELQGLVARDVRIVIECPEGVHPIEFIGRPERMSGQRGEIYLSQVGADQNRYVFLRCRVDHFQSRLATVKVSYKDELNGGNVATMTETASVQGTTNREISENSLHADVFAQKQLLITAITKDEALADADAGRYQKAAERLDGQARLLENDIKNAPAALQSQMRQEVDNLKFRSQQLQQNQYAPGLRKSMQNEAWYMRNSK